MQPAVEILSSDILSDNWYVLKKLKFRLRFASGRADEQTREVYDRGNGATVLLYNAPRRTVILTRQFRLPTYLNGNPGGMLIEACAGLLDDDAPEDCVRREAMEETGYAVGEVRKVMEAYMSPGSVTEILHFFVAPYEPAQRTGAGGGLESEGEHIEVLELAFDEALAKVADGRIRDAKTILLLQYAQLHRLLG